MNKPEEFNRMLLSLFANQQLNVGDLCFMAAHMLPRLSHLWSPPARNQAAMTTLVVYDIGP